MIWSIIRAPNKISFPPRGHSVKSEQTNVELLLQPSFKSTGLEVEPSQIFLLLIPAGLLCCSSGMGQLTGVWAATEPGTPKIHPEKSFARQGARGQGEQQ